MTDASIATRVADEFRALQGRLCDALGAADGTAFGSDPWLRPEGGGGTARVIEGGGVFEKAAVMFSAVTGQDLPPFVLREHPEVQPGTAYFATGVSLICHPRNPHVPTVHFNVRYFEAGPVHWFGGGMDLTPYYPVREDCIHFHRALKAWCDRYFYLKHRQEPRGIGGIFFNYLRDPRERTLQYVLDLGAALLLAYLPIVERRRAAPYGAREQAFQSYRRGRYVEFNLLYDQGTLFGLQSGGRIESILASLPPQVAWRYDWHPEPGSAEERLYRDFLPPQDWAGLPD